MLIPAGVPVNKKNVEEKAASLPQFFYECTGRQDEKNINSGGERGDPGREYLVNSDRKGCNAKEHKPFLPEVPDEDDPGEGERMKKESSRQVEEYPGAGNAVFRCIPEDHRCNASGIEQGEEKDKTDQSEESK